jgi:hypothetical protein
MMWICDGGLSCRQCALGAMEPGRPREKAPHVPMTSPSPGLWHCRAESGADVDAAGAYVRAQPPRVTSMHDTAANFNTFLGAISYQQAIGWF